MHDCSFAKGMCLGMMAGAAAAMAVTMTEKKTPMKKMACKARRSAEDIIDDIASMIKK